MAANYRRRLGFSVGLLLVIASLAPSVSGTEGGSEAADSASNRQHLVDQLGPLQATLRRNHSEIFGGLWVDDSGRPNEAVVGDSSGVAREAQLAGLANANFVPVDASERQLEDLHSKVVAEAGANLTIGGVPLAAVETDIINNRVNVVVVTSRADDLESISTRFGHGVQVTAVAERADGTACPNSNCPNPLKGGLKLYRSSSFACMSGFVFRWNSNYYLSTAGHCSTVGDVYQHPAGVNRGSVTHQGWVNNSPTDTSLFLISSSQKGNLVCAPLAGNCSNHTVTSRENPALGQEVIGESTCVSKQTGIDCGTLVSTNSTISICKPGTSDCRTIIQFRRSTSMLISPGDSGAAVYSNHNAIGTVSANYPGSTDTIYSHVINTEGWYLMVVQLTP